MMGFGMATGSELLSVEHVQVVALFEPDSGAIKHLHMVTTLSGGTPLTQEEAIAEAVRRAGRRNPNAKTLGIALSNDPDHGHRPHCIDPKTRAFVLLPEASGGPSDAGATRG